MNLQEQVRLRDKIMRLQEAVDSLIAENAKLLRKIEVLEADFLASKQAKLGRPRKIGS